MNNHSSKKGNQLLFSCSNNQALPLASVSSSELKTLVVPSAYAYMHAVAKQMQSTTSGAVKDVNYYICLVKEHGTHKQGKKSLKNLQGLIRSHGK